MRLFLRSWVFLGIVVGIYSELVKRQANGVESNSMSLEPGESHDAPVIDIDKPVVSSGDETGGIDVDYSGDSDDEDYDNGSGSGFEPLLPGVVTAQPTPKPKTDKLVIPKKPVTEAPVTKKPGKPTKGDNNNIPEDLDGDITVDPLDDTMNTVSNDIIPVDENEVQFSTGPPGSKDVLIPDNAAQSGTGSFMELLFSNPAILAAIIAGGVVALLSAILLVMFIVYRMRKKDEGSYSLDEPKKYKDPNMYWKDTGKEFYA